MQGGYKAATMSGGANKANAPRANNSTGPPPAPAANGSGANANGNKKPNAKKKPAANDKGNGKANGSAGADNGGGASPAVRAPPPGFAAAAKPDAAASVGFSDSQQRLLRHRALFVFRFLVGKAVEVTLVDASRYVGILDCVDPDDFSIVLKNTQRKGESDEPDFNSGSTVIFKRRQLAHMAAEGVVNYAEGAAGLNPAAAVAGAPGFRTDTEISGRSHDHLFGRELESASSWLDPQLDTGDLEDPRRRAPGKNAWNQFEANEKLFGVVSTFDENLYTTKLDKTKISNEKSREAERLAREIERETTGNFHLQEERGQAVHGGDDLDEEAKYSSVDRKQQASPVASRGPNAYVPPALRNAPRPTSAGQTKAKIVSPKTQAPATATTTAAKSAAPTPAESAPAPTPAPASVAAPSTETPPVPTTMAPPSATSAVEPAAPSSTPAPTLASQPRKPISFSEAVTGRPAAAPASVPTAPGSSKPATKQERKPSTSPKKESTPKADKPAAPAKTVSPSRTQKEPKGQVKAGSEKKMNAAQSEKKPVEANPADECKPEKKSKAAKAAAEPTPAPATDAPTVPPAAPATSAAAPAAKKALNPKAKEFKLSAAAPTFTPKFATPPAAAPVTSSPYRQSNAGHYGHMHPPPPHPAMAGIGYTPGPEEWMYDGMMLDDSEYAAAAAHAYMGYGMPIIPNPAMMQQPMYAPMMPPQQTARMGRAHGGAGGGYGYNQPGMYNPRGYYAQGAALGAMPYHPSSGAAPGVPQPPLPREPTPADATGPPEIAGDVSSAPAAASSSSTPAAAQRQPPSGGNKGEPSTKK